MLRIPIILMAIVMLVACNSSGESELDQLAIDSPGTGDGEPPVCKQSSRVVSDAEGKVDPFEYYVGSVYPVLETDCLDCHVAGGEASNTAFVLDGDAKNDYELVVEFTERELAGYPYLLAKASAIAGHTGGARFSLSSGEADILRQFAESIAGTEIPGEDGVPECTGDENPPSGGGVFLKGISLLSPEETLNKAAILMLGRRATTAELDAVSNNSDAALQETLRGMMQGSAFAEFLMTAANDQLLTNKYASGTPFIRGSSDISHYRTAAIDWPGIMDEPHYSVDDFYNEDLAREPLALIAYIVNNERDYREVVQADYTVFNSRTYEFFDADREGYVQLFNPDSGEAVPPPASPDDWVAGRFTLGVGTGFYRMTDGTPLANRVMYPHAGVLTTKPWLARWPNTNTNGQRKRAKKVLHQFLGYNIELTANRPMDADALNDPDNPTYNNPACTACHYQLDAVAGAFQNWGYLGNFRLNNRFVNSAGDYPRTDALNDGYKLETTDDCGLPLGEGGYCEGDLWYANRFPTGFVFQGESDITEMPNDGPGRAGPHDDASLRWLAAQLVTDPRFTTGTVRFWYEGVFNEKPLNPPIEGDPEYDAKIRAYIAQQEMIQQVADVFARDNGYGAYNLKDLLVAMFASDWFRAGSIDDVSGREVELANVGMGTLLTPEQLERKIESTLGVRWRLEDQYFVDRDAFTYVFNVMYGGIDSDTVNDRTRQVNPLMVSVIKRMVSEVACEAVMKDLVLDIEEAEARDGEDYDPWTHPMYLRSSGQRRLLNGYGGESPTEEMAIRNVLAKMHRVLWNDGSSPDSPEVDESYAIFEQFWDYETEENDEAMRCVSNNYQEVIPRDEAGNPAMSAAAVRVWRDMAAYFMSDAQFLHE